MYRPRRDEKISKDVVYARTDEGAPTALSRDGKYFFLVMTDSETQISDEGKVTVDTFKGKWYNHQVIMERLAELFPNSQARAISQFPAPYQIMRALEDTLEVLAGNYPAKGVLTYNVKLK